MLKLDLDEMTVENALSKCYGKIVKYQLEPVWHQVAPITFPSQIFSNVFVCFY